MTQLSRSQRKSAIIFASLVCFVTAYALLNETPHEVLDGVATAYAIEGVTKSGADAEVGVVAVDPDVIPLGSRVRIRNADDYSGVYHALDTGRNIIGNRIDIYMESTDEALEFGRQDVVIEILEYGE